MIRKKICMLGASAVGKTSLVRQFVQGIFSEQYLTTVGVKIDKKQVQVGADPVELLLWDLNGEDRYQRLEMSYLRGSAGYFLVVDGTRKPTLETAMVLHHRAQATLGEVPRVVLLNKTDLHDQWELEASEIDALRAQGWTILESSAKTGTGVEEAFLKLATLLLDA